MRLIAITFFLFTNMLLASDQCNRDWPNEEINRTCSLSAKENDINIIIEAGIFKSPCGLIEGETALKECMVFRSCGLGEENTLSGILHNRLAHLKSLCLTRKPRKVLRVSNETFVEIICKEKKAVSIKLVSGSKTKTCPFPFSMP